MEPAAGLTADLLRQIDRIIGHARKVSFQTRRRYREVAPFLAERFRLRKIANLQDKHLPAYVHVRLASGTAPATVRTDLAALRFVHDQARAARYRLGTNVALGLELPDRRHLGLGRGWTDIEYVAMQAQARGLGHVTITLVLALCRHAGLRIHEATRLDWAVARAGLRIGVLGAKGKGGRERDVHLDDLARAALQEALGRARPGQRLFVTAGVPTHRAIARIQAFVRLHRGRIEAPGRIAHLTVHGLCHTFGAARCRALLGADDSRYDAEKAVAEFSATTAAS